MARPRKFSDDERKENDKIAHAKWYKANREGRQLYAKQYKKDHPERHMFIRSRVRAKQKGIEFSITEEDIKIPSVCPILNIPLEFGDGKVQPNSPSLDRIDNNLGYVPGNVAVISYRANNMKSDMSKEDVKRLYKYIFGE